MIAIDMSTIIFADIVINFVGMVVMFILWYQNRKKYSGISYWVLDWILLTGGLLLISQQGKIPNWESTVLSNGMIVGGPLFLYFGLRQFVGKKNSPVLISAVLIFFVVFVVVHSYFTYVHVDLMARNYNAAVGLILACLLSMWLMFKEVSPEIRQVSKGTGIAFGVIVVIELIRISGFSLTHQTTNQFLESGKFDTMMVMVLEGAITFLLFNLVLMVNRRLYIETEEIGNELNQNVMELNAVFKTTPVGFGILVNRVFREVNEAFCQLLGYSREEIIGKESRMFYPTEEEYQAVGQIYKNISQTGFSMIETRLLRKDSEIINTIMSISAFDKSDLSKGVVLSLVNITERKKLEDKANYLASFPELNPNPILELDWGGNLKYQNPAMKSAFADLAPLGLKHPFLADWARVVKQLEDNNWAEAVIREIRVGNEYYEQTISAVTKNQIRIYAREVTERKRLEIEKEKYSRELTEKNTELERFTYTVSHDLKSPLVTIKTFLGYLKNDISSSDDERVEKDMLFMNNAADKMGLLLQELLEMSRIGRIVNPAVESSSAEIIKEAVGLLAGPVAARGVQVQISGESVTLYGDRSRLIEIWQNLVENAVKFMGSQPSPRIDIGVEHKDSDIVFFVRDNGIGIEPQYQPRIFNLFEKLDVKTEGTGMGLAIVKRIVELYQGKIWVESKGTGQGTTFFFTLPDALAEEKKGG
jgi:PAS domain S-box-containing protein